MFYFTENAIIQSRDGQTKTWSLAALLETHDPLPDEPLALRNAAMQQVVEMVTESYADLSETARLRYDFWKQLLPQRISEQRFEYATNVVNSYQWELKINELGVFYKDISGEYDSQLGWISEQLFSDFWFYGPLLPIPDLSVRKQLVAAIRNAFAQAGSPGSYKHFDLFEYPVQIGSHLSWSEDNYNRSDFVTVCAHGIEIGYSTWRDLMPYTWFMSFEHFLHVPPREGTAITPEIRAAIETHLAQKPIQRKVEAHTAPADNAESKRLFMDNGGDILYIHKDGFGDVYHATHNEEAAWRGELIEMYTRRLSEEDNESALAHLANGLKSNGVKNVGELLFEAFKTATPKAKQAIAKILTEQYDAERGAEALISLLEYEAETDYWRNYVFNSFFRMRDNRTVQNFIVENLRGDNEIWFKKSVDVLCMWGIYGDKDLTDREMLLSLNWNDATANDPYFRETLEKVIKIIL
jgi:hypothetical protein